MYLFGSAVSCLIGVGCLWAAVSALLTLRRRRAASVSAAGVVVDVQKQVLQAGSGGIYCPTIEFTTAAGERVRFASAFGTMPASHTMGQAVTVRYNPQAPQTAEIDSGQSNWFVPGCLLAFAAGAVFFSLMFLGLFLLTYNSGG